MAERLIVDSHGTEKVVRPLKPIASIPPEQQIVFPDKKTHDVSWRNNFAAIERIRQTLKEAEIVQEEGDYNVPLNRPDIPYAMGVIFADSHIGSYTSDHQLIKDILEITIVGDNTFLMDPGDTFDNGVWGGMEFEQTLPPYMQQFTIHDIIRELGDKYAACVIGNHAEWMFNSVGIEPEYTFAQAMKGPVFAGMGLLHLHAGEQNYDVALAHTYWGKSKKNITNVCVNLRQQEYPRANVFVVGHEHIWGSGEEMVDGIKRLYIRPGTAKTEDRYARIHGIAKRGQEMGYAVLFGTKDFTYEARPIPEAVKFMKDQAELAGIRGYFNSYS